MNSRFLHFSVMALFACALLFMTGCRVATLANVRNSPVPVMSQKQSADNVKQAILRAGAERGWRMTPAGEGHIVGDLRRRSHRAVVDIFYTDRAYDIIYKDSSNLKYDRAKSRIHSNYNAWVRNLDDTIQRELTMGR